MNFNLIEIIYCMYFVKKRGTSIENVYLLVLISSIVWRFYDDDESNVDKYKYKLSWKMCLKKMYFQNDVQMNLKFLEYFYLTYKCNFYQCFISCNLKQKNECMGNFFFLNWHNFSIEKFSNRVEPNDIC